MAQAQVLGQVARLGMDADALDLQQSGQWQFGGRMHPGLDFLVPGAARHGLQFIQYILLAHRSGLAALPQAAHHFVQ